MPKKDEKIIKFINSAELVLINKKEVNCLSKRIVENKEGIADEKNEEGRKSEKNKN